VGVGLKTPGTGKETSRDPFSSRGDHPGLREKKVWEEVRAPGS
jgi:hypothetical protein